jgi:DNA-binding transcriptional LysR family regulator
MSLDLLSLFLAVAEAGSFTAAATRLGLPKSSVSRGVAALEEELGVRLLHRTTRKVSLTTAGAALLERIAPLLGELRASLGALPEREEQPSGTLRITAANDLGAHLLPVMLARFTSRFPAVEVDVRLTNAYVDLVAEGIDVALRITQKRLADSSLSARLLGPVTMGLYAAPAYLARRGTPRTPADLEDHEWVMFRAGAPVKLESQGGTATVKRRGRVSGDDMLFIHRACREGLGVALLPTFLADADVSAGALLRVVQRWGTRSGSLWFVTPTARQQPRKVTAFRAIALETMGECPE